jgi:hypothetical protein
MGTRQSQIRGAWRTHGHRAARVHGRLRPASGRLCLPRRSTVAVVGPGRVSTSRLLVPLPFPFVPIHVRRQPAVLLCKLKHHCDAPHAPCIFHVRYMHLVETVLIGSYYWSLCHICIGYTARHLFSHHGYGSIIYGLDHPLHRHLTIFYYDM